MSGLEFYKNLPQPVAHYLFDSSKEQPFWIAVSSYHLSDEVVGDILLFGDDVVLKLLKISDLRGKIMEIAKVDESSAKAIAKDLIGYRLLPLEAYVDGLDAEVTRLGIDRKMYPQEKIALPLPPPATPVAVVQAIPSDPLRQSRLEFILQAYKKGVRDREQTLAVMGRSAKVGGLEMSPEDAAKALDAMDAKPAPKPIPKTVPKVIPKPAAPLAVITQPPKKIVLDPEVENVVRLIGKGDANRLRSIVAARFREVRGAIETKTLLGAPVDKGGLGLSPEEGETASKIIEDAVLAKAAEQNKKIDADRKRLMQSKAQDAARRAADAEREAEDLAKRYATLTGKSSTPPPPESVLPRLSQASIPPSIRGDRPQVADIKYVQKLIGPVEELKAMTLIDFRRLASDPEHAAAKILDKIALLKQESYEKMMAGVTAWRESSVNKLYVALSGEALGTGKSIAAVAEAWKAAGKEALTAGEVKAIVKLNSSIKF